MGWKKEVKDNLLVFMKAGFPFTVAGAIIVFLGLYFLKEWFEDSEYLVAILFIWLALFWFIYQPLFKKRIQQVKNGLKKH